MMANIGTEIKNIGQKVHDQPSKVPPKIGPLAGDKGSD